MPPASAPLPAPMHRRLFLFLVVLLLLYVWPRARAPTTPSVSTKTTIAQDAEDAYSYAEDWTGEREDDASFFLQIERANTAPIQLIGSIPGLVQGALLVAKPTQRESQHFPPGTIVLLTELGEDFYRGFILNSPLPPQEQLVAQRALRIQNDDEASVALDLTRVVFYGNGGPVRDEEHRWNVMHDDIGAEGAHVLGPKLAIGGDSISQVLQTSQRVVLFYGSAVWLPGQLEREVSELGLWELGSDGLKTADSLDQVLQQQQQRRAT